MNIDNDELLTKPEHHSRKKYQSLNNHIKTKMKILDSNDKKIISSIESYTNKKTNLYISNKENISPLQVNEELVKNSNNNKDRKYSINNSFMPKQFKLNTETIQKSERRSMKDPKQLKRIESFEEEFNEEDYDPLAIPPEDLIFNHPLLRPGALKKKEKKYLLIRDQNIKKKNKKDMNKTQRSFSRRILDKIYKENLSLDKKVNHIKKNRQNFNLNHYQRLLLSVGDPILSKESFIRLNTAFGDIREECGKNYEKDYNFIKEIEEQERKIVRNINHSEKSYLKFLFDNSNNDQKKIKDFNKTVLLLPKIKFRKINLNKKLHLKI